MAISKIKYSLNYFHCMFSDILNMSQKREKLTYKFYESRSVLVLKIVYFALVEFIIRYGIVIWSGAPKTARSSLFFAQKCMKIKYLIELCNTRHISYTDPTVYNYLSDKSFIEVKDKICKDLKMQLIFKFLMEKSKILINI